VQASTNVTATWCYIKFIQIPDRSLLLTFKVSGRGNHDLATWEWASVEACVLEVRREVLIPTILMMVL
jgi:hypothetical protein